MVLIEVRTTGVKRVSAKLRAIELYARKSFAPEIVDHGYLFAKNIAPRDTGALIKAIKKKKGKRSAKLSLYQPANGDGRNRPYHLWMHGIKAPVSGGAGSGYDTSTGKYAPKSGKYGPMFMFVTHEEMIKFGIERFKNKVSTL